MQQPPTAALPPLRIAFLVSDLEIGLHRRMLDVLRQSCDQRGFRLLVFEGRALNTPVFHARCHNTVYRILSDHRVDAIIVASSELGAHVGPDGLSRYLSIFPLPTVALGTPIKGISSFGGDDTAAVRLVLEHLARHGHRRIAWVSGPVSDPHALVRMFAFRDGVRAFHPGFDEREDILQGTDTAKGGYEAMARLHPRIGASLDAVCFANDEMAVGAIDYCSRHGIRVPEDVAVTGVDDIDIAALVTPGLTTVSQNLQGMAGAALDHLVGLVAAKRTAAQHGDGFDGATREGASHVAAGMQEGAAKDLPLLDPAADAAGSSGFAGIGSLTVISGSSAPPVAIEIEEEAEPALMPVIRSVFSPHLRIRGSCGCDSHELPPRNAFLDAVVHHGPSIADTIQTFDSEELFDQLAHTLRDRGVSFSFVMAYEDMPPDMSCHNFEPPAFSRMLHGYLDGRRVYEHDPFQTALLVPDAFWESLAREHLLVQPLFFQNEVFGYLVASADESQRAAIHDLRVMVGLTIKGERLIQEREQAQKRVEWALDAMRTVNTRLSDMSLRDELTGLYNRRGFLQEATRYLRGNPAQFLLVFVDMNGLKTINDRFGHDDGDLALKATADVLRQCSRDRDILARIGGDEYAMLIRDVGLEHAERLEPRFEERSRLAGERLGRPYRISLARGYVQGDAASDLDELLGEADQLMYAHKKEMKRTMDPVVLG